MREAISQLAQGSGIIPSHAGLAHDVYAPVQPGKGKVDDRDRDAWLKKLEGITPDPDYRSAFQRWKDSFGPESVTEEVVARSRLLIGHGNPSPTEVGLTLHHTWGVPVIPGTALKGLLNHYVDAVYGPVLRGPGSPHARAKDHPEADRAPWQGVTWQDRRTLRGPGEAHRAIFGAPEADDQDELQRLFGQDLPGNLGAARGLVVFHDALMVPQDAGFLSQDVLTVHHKEWYRSEGQDGFPNDWSAPNPVAFLTVRPNVRFLLVLGGPREWADLAMKLLLEALEAWGIGGKTVAGYGRLASLRAPAAAGVPGRAGNPAFAVDEKEWGNAFATYDKGRGAVMVRQGQLATAPFPVSAADLRDNPPEAFAQMDQASRNALLVKGAPVVATIRKEGRMAVLVRLRPR